MRVDLYSKVLLTIIALGQIYLCLRLGPVPVRADNGPMPVFIVGTEYTLPVGIDGTRLDGVGYNNKPRWEYVPLEVKIVDGKQSQAPK